MISLESPKPSFLDYSLPALQALLKMWGYPGYRGKQINDWIYLHFVSNPNQMRNLPEKLRQQLQNKICWQLPKLVEALEAKDGSTKLLLANHRGQTYEAVIMRYHNRTSLCVSSQVGCKLACDFCQTGKLGFFSHISRSQILGQLLMANQRLKPENRKISHVVFMGMGEPLDNYQNCISAANQMLHEQGFGLSWRHVTLSTSGIAPAIERLAEETKASLAISLHSAKDELRTELMPINRKYPLDRVKQALLTYQKVTGKIITIEYILIRDKNCQKTDAKALVKFIHGLRVKVNLIPFNSHPGMPYQRPSPETIKEFQQYLTARSIAAPVRYSRGDDVSAACGQLAAKRQNTLNQTPNRKAALLTPSDRELF